MKITLPFSLLLSAMVSVALADSGIESMSRPFKLAESQMDKITAAGSDRKTTAFVVRITGVKPEVLARITVGKDGKITHRINRHLNKANRITQTSTIVNRHRGRVNKRVNQRTSIIHRHVRKHDIKGPVNIVQTAHIFQKASH